MNNNNGQQEQQKPDPILNCIIFDLLIATSIFLDWHHKTPIHFHSFEIVFFVDIVFLV